MNEEKGFNFNFDLDPFLNFQNLFNQAQKRGIPEHHAMTLATSKDHRPSLRIVYFKGFIRGGFSFYTNYQGRKGQELENNQFVSANFFWPHMDVQFRIEGRAEKLTEAESDQYFSSRARLNQIGAWASKQSLQLDSFNTFQNQISEFENKFSNQKIPRPPHWGGFRILPSEIECWFMRSGRLHERYIYSAIDYNPVKIQNFSDYTWKKFLRYP